MERTQTSEQILARDSAISGAVLLVEDDDDDAFMVQRALSKAGVSQTVIHLQDGEEAMKYLEGQPPYNDRKKHPIPQLVLLDLKMPRMTGIDVLAWLQTQPALAKLPVVVLTGSVRDEDRAEADKLGAVGYQVKPVGFNDLVQIVKDIQGQWLR